MSALTPHGEGFSFLDHFVVTETGRRGKGGKWLAPELSFFADHFPGKPMMPAVLLVECAAQAAGALWASLQGADAPVRYVLAQILQFKILRSVLPGEKIEMEVTLEKTLGQLAQFQAVLSVAGVEVACGKIVLGMEAASTSKA